MISSIFKILKSNNQKGGLKPTLQALFLSILIILLLIIFNLRSEKFHYIKLENMIIPRAGHSTLTLKDGRVLILGNWNSNINKYKFRIAEVFDPKTNKFHRINHTNLDHINPKLILMSDGRVVILEKRWMRNKTFMEIFDPIRSEFEEVISLNKPNTDDAILLKDNLILLNYGKHVEIYDLNANKILRTAKHLIIRSGYEKVLLPDGKVLFIGGKDSMDYVKDVISYDPKTNKFSIVGKIKIPRYNPACILLKNGKILILGGISSKAELYDYKTNKSYIVGNMLKNRTSGYGFKAILLNDGRVLISGGSKILKSLSSFEIYDPKTNKFTLFETTYIGRQAHQLSLLNNGNVLITGGLSSFNSDDKPMDSAEVILINKSK